MSEPPPPRIAMWSGSRNISTALLWSWGARDDTVVDEPLYAHYLAVTGRAHPGREEIIDRYETDWRAVVECITRPIPDGASIYYQKHMAHHLLPEMKSDWVGALRNAFPTQEPREMLTSLVEFLPEPTFSNTGLPQQRRLFRQLREQRDEPPPVITVRDVPTAPRSVLTVLCEALGVPFRDSDALVGPGPRETDSLWALYTTRRASELSRPLYRRKERIEGGVRSQQRGRRKLHRGLVIE